MTKKTIEEKIEEVISKPKLTEEEATTLARFKNQGSFSRDEALEFHRLLNIQGE